MRSSKILLASPLLLSGFTLGCNDLTNDIAQPGDVTESAAVTAMSADECTDGPSDHAGKKFEKRCRHYKHSERSRAYQAGAAKMTTRALIDVNKVTTLEATTGTFDDGSTPPGWFDKVRVRTARMKRNYTPRRRRRRSRLRRLQNQERVLLGRVPHPTTARRQNQTRRQGRHARQAAPQPEGADHRSIKGVDPRTAVISIDDQVKYRPDLSIVRIDAPSAAIGMPANITAMIHESMGDLGALADCVLSVDGVVSDRAPNVWVDKNGTVSCQFAHTFTAGGVHALHVDIANVRPGDYDMRNNGADATIAVSSTFSFSGSAMDGAYTSSYREQVLDAGSNVLFEQNSISTGHNHSVTMSGMWPQTRGVSALVHVGQRQLGRRHLDGICRHRVRGRCARRRQHVRFGARRHRVQLGDAVLELSRQSGHAGHCVRVRWRRHLSLGHGVPPDLVVLRLRGRLHLEQRRQQQRRRRPLPSMAP